MKLRINSESLATYLPIVVVAFGLSVVVVRVLLKYNEGVIQRWELSGYLVLSTLILMLSLLGSVAYYQLIIHRKTIYWLLSRQQAIIDGIKSFEAAREDDCEVNVEAAEPRDVSRWPWGGHHTEQLGHLEAAAKQFWVNYDPEDPSTAPTIEMVSTWLKTTRGVSGDKARAIASILRADGLPHGPRR